MHRITPGIHKAHRTVICEWAEKMLASYDLNDEPSHLSMTEKTARQVLSFLHKSAHKTYTKSARELMWAVNDFQNEVELSDADRGLLHVPFESAHNLVQRALAYASN